MNESPENSGDPTKDLLSTIQPKSSRMSADRRRDIQLLHAISESAIVTLAEMDGKITYVNESLLRITGYTREEVIGSTHADLFNSGFHDPQIFEDLWKDVAGGKIWRGELRHRKKNGDFYWVHVTVTPITDDHGKIREILAIEFDITDRVETEARLVHAAKMSALGEMAGSIAHEINNPLSILLGRVAQLRQELTDNEIHARIRTVTDKLESTAERIARIVKGLRNFAREGSNDAFVETAVDALLSETLDLCDQRIRMQEIHLRLLLPQTRTVLECRPVQLMQVLMNLINNAADAIEERPNRWIEISVENEEEHVLFSVRDSGIPVSPQIHAKFFQPFFTTKGAGRGTGLGLSISRGIAEAHRGQIFFDSSESHTCFRLRLPKKQPRPTRASNADS